MTVTTRMSIHDETEINKLKEIQKRMGEVIAYFELAQANLETWKDEIHATMEANQLSINAQLDQIRSTTQELQNIMTEAGVARWRIAAENSLKQGEKHLNNLENLSQETLEKWNDAIQNVLSLAKESFKRLDRASSYTIQNISDAISSFDLHRLQRLTDQSRELVEETSLSAIKRLKDTVRWFQWKNISLVFIMTIFASFIIALYINDEMPWETHKQVVAQRNAGEALIHAWHTLSDDEQQRILEHAKKAIT